MTETRFDSAHAQQYWREHASARGPVDFERDPEGLNNVLHSGQPLWLNQYYARFQRMVFEALLERVDRDLTGTVRRALDVGCGAGRWCRLLVEHGYDTTGVDLQEELVRRNREAMPNAKFVCAPLQDFSSDASFDLITTVTVVQHNPPADQDRMIAHMRRLLRTGGQVLALENIADQDVHVFANSIEEWTARFERAGFRRKAVRRYDFSPLLRTQRLVASSVLRLVRGARGAQGEQREQPARAADAQPPPARQPGPQSGDSRLRSALRTVRNGALRVCVAGDSAIEGLLIELNAPLPTVHCGFQFEAV